MVSWDPSSSNMVLIFSSSKLKFDVMVVTQKKDYGNVSPPNSQTTNQIASSTSPSYDSTTPLFL